MTPAGYLQNWKTEHPRPPRIKRYSQHYQQDFLVSALLSCTAEAREIGSRLRDRKNHVCVLQNKNNNKLKILRIFALRRFSRRHWFQNCVWRFILKDMTAFEGIEIILYSNWHRGNYNFTGNINTLCFFRIWNFAGNR